MRAFIDSSVAVYALVADGSLQHATALQLIEAHGETDLLVVSTQVLLETYNVLVNRKRLPSRLALAAVELLARHEVISPSRRSALAAAELAAQHSVSIWDAFIVQAALQAGCEVLYSEDLQAGRRFGTLEVVNPFEVAAHEAAPAYAGKTAKTVPKKTAKKSANSAEKKEVGITRAPPR